MGINLIECYPFVTNYYIDIPYLYYLDEQMETHLLYTIIERK